MVAPGICHVKARLVDLIGSSGIENATSAQPKNLVSAPRRSPLPFFGGVAGDETTRRERVWYFTVSGFVLLSQLSQAAVGKLMRKQIYSGYFSCNGGLAHSFQANRLL